MPDFNVISLTDRSVIGLTGSSAKSFLQGLITQDINLLDKDPSIYAGLLTPQGKILFDFFIQKEEGKYLIDCTKEATEALLAKMNMYKLRADVELTNLSTHYAVAACGIPTIEISSPDPRSLGLGYREIIKKEAFKKSETSQEAYTATRLKLGIADSDEIGSGQHFPHECNFDQLNGVSLKKGCFIGQEVVSRMDHRGTVRSRILPFSSEAPSLVTQEKVTGGDKTLGTLLSYKNGHGLALIRIDRLEKSLEASLPILADNKPVTFYKPEWADFNMPTLKEKP